MWSLNTIKHINLSSMFIFDSSHHIVYKLQIICIIFNLLSLSCHDHQLCWILGLCIDCFRNKIVIHPPTPPNEISLVHSHCLPNNTITMVNVFTIPADTHFIFNSLLIKQTPRCRWMCLHNTHHGFYKNKKSCCVFRGHIFVNLLRKGGTFKNPPKARNCNICLICDKSAYATSQICLLRQLSASNHGCRDWQFNGPGGCLLKSDAYRGSPVYDAVLGEA